MPNQMVLHIGPHKTATTSIQRVLETHTDALIQCGVFYIKEFFPLAQLLVENSPLEPDRFANVQGNFRHLFGQLHGQLVVGSAENFFGRMNKENGLDRTAAIVADLKRLLDPLDVTLRVVAVPRRQDRWIESVYQQVVKWNETRTFAEFFATLDPAAFQWDRLLDLYTDAFGEETVRAMPFEELFGGHGRGVKRLWSMMAIPPGALPDTLPRANPGLSHVGLEILRRSNDITVWDERQDLRAFLEHRFPRKPGERVPGVTEAEMARFMAALEGSNRRLAERYYR